MTIKKFSTKFNAFTWYAPGVANNDKGKIEIFINGLRSKIANNMLTGDNPPLPLPPLILYRGIK